MSWLIFFYFSLFLYNITVLSKSYSCCRTRLTFRRLFKVSGVWRNSFSNSFGIVFGSSSWNSSDSLFWNSSGRPLEFPLKITLGASLIVQLEVLLGVSLRTPPKVYPANPSDADVSLNVALGVLPLEYMELLRKFQKELGWKGSYCRNSWGSSCSNSSKIYLGVYLEAP